MLRVLLITKNKVLSDFCRKNLPDTFSLKTVTRLNFNGEAAQGIVIFDSAYLSETSDTVIAAAAQRFGAKDGAVSLSILMNEEDAARAFSLFPENLLHIQAILRYRTDNGKISGLATSEWRWFLETQHRHLRQLSDRALTLGENELLAGRLARVDLQPRNQLKFPAFMHGKSQAIVRFREQLFAATSAEPYLFITGKGDLPTEEFLDYYCSLLRPEATTAFRLVDLAKVPKHLHQQALWPGKKKGKAQHKTDISVVCVKNLHLLGWQNQATLLQNLKNLPEKLNSEEKRVRHVFMAPPEVQQQVKRGSFRQELLSLLRKANVEVPPLYDRPEDLSQIAAEYISKHEFKLLAEQKGEVARKILNRFDLSSGYGGLYLTLDLMNDLEKGKGLPLFELMGSADTSDAFVAARAFLREQTEPDPVTLFQNLAGGEKEALSLDFVERNYIAAVCQRYAWQVTETARHLGISRKTLYDKMRRYKLNRPENQSRGKARKAS